MKSIEIFFHFVLYYTNSGELTEPAEGARLLSEYTPQGYLGFESPALRQKPRYALRMHECRERKFKFVNIPQINTDYIIYIACCVCSFVPAIVLHEMAHGFAAFKLGDPTAKRAGRLSINPLKHIDVFGTVIMPALLMVFQMPVFGYAKPVPYNPMYFKDPRKGDLIVGLAGPCANLILALIAAAIA